MPMAASAFARCHRGHRGGAAVLSKGKAVTRKLVPPNTCHRLSARALKCWLVTNRDWVGGGSG